MTRTRVLIVDDEPLARDRIRTLLAGDNEVEVVGECADGREAVAAIRELSPDLVFLDIQMPDLDGFGVVGEIGVADMPATVFVTAYDRHALRAFEVAALDYLLKPFDRARFRAALDRAQEWLRRDRASNAPGDLTALLDEIQALRRPSDRIAVKVDGRILLLPIESVDWVEAAGNYSKLHVGKDVHLIRETMASLEAKFDTRRFARIHRSTIVNVERIRELQPHFHGDYIVVLRDGTELTMSRGYRPKLQLLLGGSL
jgi:two-component system LytT family response regulator